MHMHSAIELRSAKRYRLSVPALFMWAPQEGKPRNGKGVTRDINALGVYVQTDSLPPVGARVQMEVVLPKLADSSPGMHLQGEGIVLRCETLRSYETWFCRFGIVLPRSDRSSSVATESFRADCLSQVGKLAGNVRRASSISSFSFEEAVEKGTFRVRMAKLCLKLPSEQRV